MVENFFVRVLGCALLIGISADAFGLPGPVQNAKPNPEPTLPSSVDSFAPPVTAAAALSTAPAFAEWTRTAAPAETLALTGIRFSTFGASDEGKDTTFLTFGQTLPTNPALFPGRIRRLDGGKAAITLDQGLPPDSMVLLWTANQNGYSAPIAINKTEAWWLGPARSTRGASVSVYGRELSRSNPTKKPLVYLKTAGLTAGVWATVNTWNPYKVDFSVPPGLSNGAYEVWIHNGRGGHYGWSGPLILTVDNGPNWTGPEFNVKTLGALGNGANDDGAAIAAALSSAAAQSGATVYFPPGTYRITDYLSIPANVRLRGDSRDVATIVLDVPAGATSNPVVLYPEGSNVEVRDLTLKAIGALPIDIRVYTYIIVAAEGVNDLRFNGIRIDGKGCNTYYTLRSQRISFNNCEIIGRNGYLLSSRQVFFAGCSFYQTNDAQVPVWAYGGGEISMTGCSNRDLDSSNPASDAGWGLGRWFVGNGYYGTQRHIYLGDNISTDLGVRSGATNQNSGEQFLWEQNNHYFEGPVVAATAMGATLSGYTGNVDNFVPGQNDNAFDTEAIVVGGKGLGQHRAIASVNPATQSITLKEAWNVLPDTSSTISIMTTAARIVVYHNYLDGKPYVYQQEPHIASAGVQVFEGALDVVVDSNTFHEIRNAISLWGYSDQHQNRPVYFGTYANNVIDSNRWGVRFLTQAPQRGVNFLGNVFRRNTLRNIVFDGFTMISDPGTNSSPWFNTNIIERTDATNLPLGITQSGMTGSMTNTVALSNSFNRGSAAVSGSKAITFLAKEVPCLRGNTYSGFEKTYDGGLPGAVLETPYRVLSFSSAVNGPVTRGGVDVWNGGSNPMAWRASSNTIWLTLDSSVGSVLGENSWSNLTFKCDPRGLSAGIYTGYISLANATQTKRVKVIFSIQ